MMDPTWHNIFVLVIALVMALLGAPVTQGLKLLLTVILKKPIQNSAALLVTGVVAALFGVGELALTGQITWESFSLVNFPTTFFAVFSIATVYYALLKGTEGFFGKAFMLKPVGEVLAPEPPL